MFNAFYDRFNYLLNTTQCPDGTLCRFANNEACCDANKGIREIQYDYNSSAVMPKDEEQLSTFYAAAGYKFPNSIPRMHPTLPPRPSSYLLAPPENLNNTEMAATATPRAFLSPMSSQATAASSTTPKASSGPDSAHSTAASSRNSKASSGPSSAQSTAASSRTSKASSGPTSARSTAASSGLNPGAKAGITIGITLSIVLCTACVVLLYQRQRRRHRQQHRLQPQPQQQHQQQQYGSDTPKDLAPSLTALAQDYSAELEGTPVGSKMKASQKTHESLGGLLR